MTIRILHVTEALGGGVTSAINTYVEHSQQFEHYLFASVRVKDATGEESVGIFKGARIVTHWSGFFLLYKYIKEIQPDVIHVHSSYAGVFVRLFPFASRRKIVYTPHAFAFLRNDNALKLKVYYFIEWLLSFRTAVIAGCGRDERNIASQLNSTIENFELINVCGPLPNLDRKCQNALPVIVMIGRVCDQKGYQFFADVASSVGAMAKFLWIGGGDDTSVSVLTSAGVSVTGWISRPEVLQHLVNSDVYFHSAAWDGFPISVLEAAHYKLPMLLRGIGPFRAENLSVTESVTEAAQAIKQCVSDDADVLNILTNNSTMVREYHTSENLSEALSQLYNKFEPKDEL